MWVGIDLRQQPRHAPGFERLQHVWRGFRTHALGDYSFELLHCNSSKLSIVLMSLQLHIVLIAIVSNLSRTANPNILSVHQKHHAAECFLSFHTKPRLVVCKDNLDRTYNCYRQLACVACTLETSALSGSSVWVQWIRNQPMPIAIKHCLTSQDIMQLHSIQYWHPDGPVRGLLMHPNGCMPLEFP